MKFDIIRAWKDEAYRASLSTEEQAMLPENPAGALELSDAELEAVHGAQLIGISSIVICSTFGNNNGCNGNGINIGL